MQRDSVTVVIVNESAAVSDDTAREVSAKCEADLRRERCLAGSHIEVIPLRGTAEIPADAAVVRWLDADTCSDSVRCGVGLHAYVFVSNAGTSLECITRDMVRGLVVEEGAP